MRYIVVTPFIGQAAEGHRAALDRLPEHFFCYYDEFPLCRAAMYQMPTVPWDFLGELHGDLVAREYRDIDLLTYNGPWTRLHHSKGYYDARMTFITSFRITEGLEKFTTLIDLFRPKVFVTEMPVPVFYKETAATVGHADAIAALYHSGWDLGYSTTFWYSLPTMHGVPDQMPRCFMIWWRADRCPVIPVCRRKWRTVRTETNFKNFSGEDGSTIDIAMETEYLSNPYVRWGHTTWGPRWSDDIFDASALTKFKQLRKLVEFAQWCYRHRYDGDAYFAAYRDLRRIIKDHSPIDRSPKFLTVYSENVYFNSYEELVHPNRIRFLRFDEVFRFAGVSESVIDYLVQERARTPGGFGRLATTQTPWAVWRDLTLTIQRAIESGRAVQSSDALTFYSYSAGRRVVRPIPELPDRKPKWKSSSYASSRSNSRRLPVSGSLTSFSSRTRRS